MLFGVCLFICLFIYLSVFAITPKVNELTFLMFYVL